MQKQNRPRNQIEKIWFLHRDRLSSDWNSNRLRRTGRWMPHNKFRSYPPRPLHAESFSGPDALIRRCLNRNLASEAGAIFGADPSGLHGLTCPWALSSSDIGPKIFPDTAIEPGKHFLCNDHCQTAVSEIPKSVIRTNKVTSHFQPLDSDWNSRTQRNDNYVRPI